MGCKQSSVSFRLTHVRVLVQKHWGGAVKRAVLPPEGDVAGARTLDELRTWTWDGSNIYVSHFHTVVLASSAVSQKETASMKQSIKSVPQALSFSAGGNYGPDSLNLEIQKRIKTQTIFRHHTFYLPACLLLQFYGFLWFLGDIFITQTFWK